MFFFNVLVAHSFCSKPYTYSYEHDLPLGTVILVEFGYKRCLGVVVSQSEGILEAKNIIYVYHTQFSDNFLLFLKHFASYNFIKIGAALEMSLPNIAFKKSLPILLKYNEMAYDLATLLKMLPLKEIKQLTATSIFVNTMEQGKMSDDQIEAVDQIINAKRLVSVLEGVTGSGKTLVALEVIKEFIRQHGLNFKILILVPEINLVHGWVKAIKQELNYIAFVFHSKMSSSFKKSFFNWAISSENGIVVGTRSALLLPYSNLSYVILDEEHARSYRQDVYPYYHARDMAILLASYLKIKVLLMSATLSLETVLNIQKQKYTHYKLSRQPQHGLAEVFYSQGYVKELLSPEILENVTKKFENNEQVFFFLNRKGYASYCYCTKCKNLLLCLNCESALTLYYGYEVVCHKCYKRKMLPKICPHCNVLTTWYFFGIGVEKLQEFLQIKFPDKKFSVITCDEKNIEAQLQEIENNSVHGIIATQILAQGHDFKNIGLVVVVDADMGLSSTDFRCLEYTYQLWQQIRGRSGRHHLKGKMILQSFKRDNKFIDLFKQDKVYEFLLKDREHNDWPPFSQCALLKFKGKKHEVLKKLIDQMNFQDESILGPLYWGVLNKTYEYRFLLKEKNYNVLYKKLIQIQEKYPKCEVEMNPY